jgi:hypothetical protein
MTEMQLTTEILTGEDIEPGSFVIINMAPVPTVGVL